MATPTNPTVFSVTASGAGITNGNGDIGAGDIVTFTVTFNQDVKIIGTPTLTLNNGGTATYSCVGGNNAILIYTYTVLATDLSVSDLQIKSYNLPAGATIAGKSGNRPADFVGAQTNPDGSLQIDIPAVCFAGGTHLLTSKGDVLVDVLQLGELMVNANGTVTPVKWIGRRRIDIATHPRPETVAPIRIQRDAFADNVPYNDLVVSPDHAIFVDGKLIAARQLINGTTIRQEHGRSSVEYFHVELDTHSVLLAEGLPAESYLDTGNRGFFANSGEPLVLYPDLTDEADCPTREAASCAPFAWDEAAVQPVWQRLAERAATLGQPVPSPQTTTNPNLHLVVKGQNLWPLFSENGLFIFALPLGTKEAQLMSRAGSPTDVRPWLEDRRSLGLYVERIVLRDANDMQEIAIDDPALSEGWWAVEKEGIAHRRWTNGNAVLPLHRMPGAAMLEIRVGGSRQYLVKAKDRAAA
jgi:hypothetical protein